MMLIACMAAAAAGGCAGPGNDPNETKKPDVTEVPAAPTEEPTAVPWQTDDQGRRLAGSDITATVKRDGTPKKYFTISFDDGITQDERIIEIYKKYNFKGGTFFIDTGKIKLQRLCIDAADRQRVKAGCMMRINIKIRNIILSKIK